MQIRLWVKAQTKIKITDGFKAKDGRYVNRILKNVKINFRKNAITYRITAMG